MHIGWKSVLIEDIDPRLRVISMQGID